jgi:hypothetical protein
MLGKYPVGRDDAAHLAALQLLAEIGSVANPETCMQTLAFGELIDSWIGEGVPGDQSYAQPLHVALPLCPYALPQPDKDLWTKQIVICLNIIQKSAFLSSCHISRSSRKTWSWHWLAFKRHESVQLQQMSDKLKKIWKWYLNHKGK